MIINKPLAHTRVLYFFLIYMLFVNSITNRFSVEMAYSFIILFLGFIFVLKTKQTFRLEYVVYASFMVMVLSLSHLYQQIVYEHNNLYFIQFFGSQILFFIFFAFCIDIKLFENLYLEKFLRLAIVVIFLFVIIDFVLLQLDLASWQPMYREYAKSYRFKPLGLFGQFSVTTTYSVVFYLLYLSLDKKVNLFSSVVLFIFVSIVILLQNSGTGYIVYTLMLCTLFYHFKLFKVVLIPLTLILVSSIILSGAVTKISLEYLWILVNDHALFLINEYSEKVNSILDIFLGIGYGDIDFGPYFFIGNIGLLYFILYSIILFYMMWKNKNIYYRMAMVSLMFGNLHYPVLFYPLMNVFMPLLLLMTLHKNSPKKTV